MKVSNFSKLILFCILILSCNKYKVQIKDYEIVYNSERYNGEKYDISLNTKIFVQNEYNKFLPFDINKIDTLYFYVDDKKYVMTAITDNFRKKNQIKPNSKILVEYISNYRSISENAEDGQIYNRIKNSILRDSDGNILKRSPEFTIRQVFKAYIKKKYYTPNGTIIEEIGD